MIGFAALAVIALVGILVTAAWMVGVSLGIRRDDRSGIVTAAAPGAVPGRVSRLARHSTGLHRV